eukprot:7118148-Pyramimonas_sp.AAC.1
MQFGDLGHTVIRLRSQLTKIRPPDHGCATAALGSLEVDPGHCDAGEEERLVRHILCTAMPE